MKRTLGLALVALLVAAAPARAADQNQTVLVGGPSNVFAPLLTPLGFASNLADSITANGRWVAFRSSADGLMDGDDDRYQNVYVRDTLTGELTLINAASDGEPGHGSSTDLAMEDDESSPPRVVFTTEAALFVGDTDGGEDVYVRDLTTGSVRMVSRVTGANGASPPGNVSGVAIDGTGDVVAFSTTVALDPADVNADSDDVYSRDLSTDTTRWESQMEDGGGGPTSVSPGVPASATQPDLSPDGEAVVFQSNATDLDAEVVTDTNNAADTFIRFRDSGETGLISAVNGSSTVAGAGSGVSGQFVTNVPPNPPVYHVVFASNQTNLVAGDTDNSTDVFRRTYNTTATEMLSLNTADAQTSAQTFVADIDDTANEILMRAFGADLFTNDTNETVDVVLRSRTGPGMGSTRLVSRADGAAGAQFANESSGGALSASGDWSAYYTFAPEAVPGAIKSFRSGVVRRPLFGAENNQLVSGPATPIENPGGESRLPGRRAVSADGRYVLFAHRGAGISPDDAPGDTLVEVYRRDLQTGETVLVSREDGAAGAPITSDFSFSAAISADGNRVVFVPSQLGRVLVRDIAAGTTALVNRQPDGTVDSALGSGGVDISRDGTRAAYTSFTDLTGTGELPAAGMDVFVRDLNSDTITLASVGDGEGPDGNADSYGPVLDATGVRVAFVSVATNLGDGDADAASDIHLRDTGAKTTTLISRSTGGVKIDTAAFLPSISADGTRVTFVTNASNLDPAATGPDAHLFVRDLTAQTTTLVSRDGPGGPALTGGVSLAGSSASISADGNAFAWIQNDYTPPGGSPGPGQALVRTLDGPVDVASRSDGANGLLADQQVLGVAVDADGSCVAFDSGAQNVFSGPLPGDSATTWLRVRGLGCPDRSPVAGPPPPGAGDTTAPVINRLRLSRARFRAKGKRRRGTRVLFELSEKATVKLRIARRAKGRRSGGKCVKPRPRLRRRKACARYVRRATITRPDVEAGDVTIAFSGRVKRKSLARGRYRLTVGATDAAGNAAIPRRTSFRIIR